jgi:hypothetical protein
MRNTAPIELIQSRGFAYIQFQQAGDGTALVRGEGV